MGDSGDSAGADQDELGASVREAVLALEGTVIEDFQLPLPGDLRDLAKAAALVSGIVEDRIPTMLNQVRSQTWDKDGHLHQFEFRRSTIGFPDVLLVLRANPEVVIFEIEAKSWYVLSRDPLTARFETSAEFINDATLIVVVAWVLDGVVSGSPKLLRLHVDNAKRLAKARDAEWVRNEPSTHRVVEPAEAPAGTTANLIETKVRGEQLKNGRWSKDAENFGKIERIHDSDIAQFRDTVWSLQAGGKTFREWQRFATRD